ncbi:DUF423 domain-containing protein [Vibrio scophthalmi]|uniref:DUF423 domain-containing protein n=1 Tax=Vibrio scophthalmi TaxID=45658 RepID=UPI002FF1229F
MKSNHLLALGGMFAGLGVALGAFAAHGLKAMLPPYLLEVFQTGVHYQFLHAIAIMLCALFLRLTSFSAGEKNFARAAICFIIGIFCFSGSLYALAITGIKWFGPITPFGGVMFLIGWALFVVAALQSNEVNQ